MKDTLSRYYFPELGVRAALARLDHSYARMAERGDYTPQTAIWLGEFAAAAALFTSGIHLDGRLSLQLQSPGTMKLLYAECTSQGDLRGLARCEPPVSESLGQAVADGRLAITIEPEGAPRYQGIVGLEGERLSDYFEGYFAQSEQIPTRLLLSCDGKRAVGLMLQRVASGGGNAPVDPDGWNRLGFLANTLQPSELLELDAETLFAKVFPGEVLQDLGTQALRFSCRCSRDKVASMLRSLGRDEALLSVQSDAHAEITCEFCNAQYRFDIVDIEQLFFDSAQAPSGRLQ